MSRRFTKLEFEPPYDRVLDGVLSFSSFSHAEASIRRLEFLRQSFHTAGDKKGVHYCRQLGRLGRRRAELISQNIRVSDVKRLNKKEISFWFGVWLETPELFEDWLALRKESEEFRRIEQPAPVGPFL